MKAAFGVPPLGDYGLSEVPGHAAHAPDDPEEKILRTEGRPYDGTEIRIVDEETEEPVPAGTVGAVIVNGPSRFLGFFNNDELTRESLTDWGGYRTGDLGMLDDEGHFVYVGRSKDIIRRGGVTIVPAEVEPVISRHPAVHEVAIVPIPDDRLGERACAALIARPGSAAPTLQELQAFLDAEGVAKYTWPESVEVFDQFPRTPSLKVVKRDVVHGDSRANARDDVTGGRGRSDGAKRQEILAAATARFGRDGYENTKWADIAADVGVGPTALYHYFESKQHCLYEIMDDAIDDFRRRFEEIADREADPVKALVMVLQDCFELSEMDVQRNRLLVAEQGRLGGPRASPREEQARQTARARSRDLEFAWASFLSSGMRQGVIPQNDPRLLARAILGLYNSIWQWYRPNGIVALRRVAEFFIERILAMIGIPPETEVRRQMVA